ncbi:cob(I)yrinic acid a,c-diamide adenosyltransferase [bacterium]|nr:cob(I)yrinic acid a,c-diamide adenosyltransferase [bacterium]MBU1936871.1 cob(I)yrinic acid a,c-diamide adenosyltransferase [bacterium]
MTHERTPPKSRGLVLVFTGNGKGKTTAAFGTVLRAVAYGHRCLVVQFIKEPGKSKDQDALKRLPGVDVHAMGRGFVGIMDDALPREEHIAAARKALEFVHEKILSGDYRLIVLDEVNVALNLKLLSTDAVLGLLKARPIDVSLILTGRGAPHEIIKRADTVTEMTEIKHAFQAGIPALEGLDF